MQVEVKEIREAFEENKQTIDRFKFSRIIVNIALVISLLVIMFIPFLEFGRSSYSLKSASLFNVWFTKGYVRSEITDWLNLVGVVNLAFFASCLILVIIDICRYTSKDPEKLFILFQKRYTTEKKGLMKVGRRNPQVGNWISFFLMIVFDFCLMESTFSSYTELRITWVIAFVIAIIVLCVGLLIWSGRISREIDVAIEQHRYKLLVQKSNKQNNEII